MKTLKQLSLLFSILTLSLFAARVQASPMFHDIDEDYLIRVTVTEDVAEKLSVTHLHNGEEVTTPVANGEILSISLVDNMADPLILPFSAIKDGDQFVLDLGDSDPMNSLNPILGYHSDLSTYSADKQSAVTITAPQGKMYVVYAPEGPQEIAEPDSLYPLEIGEAFQVFSMDGILDIQFIVKPVQAGDEEGGDQGTGDNGEDDGLNQGLGEGAAGGCSMLAATGSATGGLAGLSFLTLAGLLGLRRRAK